MNLNTWQLVLAVLGGLCVGVSKTGIGGIGVLTTALFALIIPAKQSTGVVLPLLILGDIIAVVIYQRHAVWTHIWRLLPWAGLGIVVGWLAMSRIDDREARLLIGGIVLALTAVQIARRWTGADRTAPRAWFAPAIGVFTGFTTLVANAAGALMGVYLLATRLSKLDQVGTGAVFFLIVNVIKVPFIAQLGLLTADSLALNLRLAPAVQIGTVAGRWLLARLDQRTFENATLALGTLAGAKLLLDALTQP
jgi:uncharacterized membrane protein YfcA